MHIWPHLTCNDHKSVTIIMNQMWVEIGLNTFQINCSDDSRYANDQYHIFWQFRSYASNANMANVIWYLTGKLYVSAKTLLFVSLV